MLIFFTIFDHFLTIFDIFWPFLTIFFFTIFDHFWPFLTIFFYHFWPFWTVFLIKGREVLPNPKKSLSEKTEVVKKGGAQNLFGEIVDTLFIKLLPLLTVLASAEKYWDLLFNCNTQKKYWNAQIIFKYKMTLKWFNENLGRRTHHLRSALSSSSLHRYSLSNICLHLFFSQIRIIYIYKTSAS